MKRQQIFLVAAVLGVVGAAAVSRTARVRGASIVRTSNAPTPTAEVALDYTRGPRPQYVIVDLHGNHGSGSATVDGEEDSVLVALTGPLGVAPKIEVTASTRVLGQLQTRRTVFG